MKRQLLNLIFISLTFTSFSQSFKREIFGEDTIYTHNLPKDCWCEFDDSIKNGKIRAVNPTDGTIVYTGFFRNFKRDGVWKTYSQNGDSSVIEIRNYKNGLLDGYSYFDAYGLYQSGLYKNGLREGPWEEKENNLYIRAKGEYRNDKRVGIWLFYDTLGVIKQQNNYGNGLKIFEKILWYNYEKKIIEEKGLCYYGRVESCMPMYMELWHGKTVIYNLKGEETGEKIYKEGKLISAKETYDNGFPKMEVSDSGRSEKEWFENGQLKRIKSHDSLYIKEWFSNGRPKSYYRFSPSSFLEFTTLVSLWDSTGTQLVKNGLGEYSELNSNGEKLNYVITNKFKKCETYNINAQLVRLELFELGKKIKRWEYEYLNGTLIEERFYKNNKLKKTKTY